MERSRAATKREERISAIVDAARRLFDEKGYDAVTMREIANEVGKSPGLIYRYRESKAEILEDILADYVRKQAAHLGAIEPPSGTALDRLMHYLCAMFAFDLERLALRRLACTQSWKWDRPTETRFFVEVIDIFEPIMASLQEVGITLDEPARWAIWAIYTEALRRADYEIDYARELKQADSEDRQKERLVFNTEEEVRKFNQKIRPQVALLIKGLTAG
jgi:AcrR family transcriptional regulator